MTSDDTENLNSLRGNFGEIDGAILSMHIRNFFCHDSLEIKFNKNINFIVGRNGSGKSAILTGLVVGLGGRAAATNRGTSLHSFIKKGTNSAHIEIKIKNDSPNAYKHDVYGDVITIVRTLNASGGSSYKIKNESGHTISTKYDDVSMICSVHDIQVDNPICVLNQDDARNFHASDAKKKYSLFRKATNMDVVQVNYQKALKNCAHAKMTLEKKKQAFSELENELHQLKIKYDKMRSRDEVQAQVRLLEDEYHWSEIAEMEQTLSQLKKALAKQTNKVNNLTTQINELDEKDKNFQQNISNIKQQLNNIAITSASKDEDLKNMSSELQRLRIEWKVCLGELKKKKEQLSREGAKVKDLSREVDVATNVDLAQERNSLQAKLSDLEGKLKEVAARKETTEHELNQTRSAISHEQSSLSSISKKRENVQNSLRHVKSQLNELNVRGKDNLAVYGKNMTDLVAAVKKANSQGVFSEMPRGPIGSYLKVHKKKWSSALEHIIGGSLKTFCVNNDEDSRRLFKIMQNIYGNEQKPSITTSKFFHKVHNVSRKCVEAPRDLCSSLDCLQISDPVVANFLIDNIGMESILMVPSHDQATSLATEESRVPTNCAKIVTLDQTEFYPAPNYRSYGGTGKPSRYLQVSTSERKMQLQSELEVLEKDLCETDIEYRKLKQECQKLSNREEELDLQLRKLLKAQQILQGKIMSINSSIRELEGGHIKVLTEELNEAKVKLASLNEEESSLSEKENDLRTRTKEVESKVSKLRREKDALHIALNDEINQEQLKMERNKSEMEMIKQAYIDEESKFVDVTDKLTKHSSHVSEKITKAEHLCPRIENTRSMNIIITELKKVKSKLDSMKKNGPSKQQVADTLIEKENLFRTTSRIIMQLNLLINKLEKAVTHHLHSAIQLQSLIANRVQYCFQLILKVRGYLGSMEIDNDKGILDIKCTGRDSAAVRVASSTRSLSGGERSYATVAFIMALWDCMELPFYFLDEFDVFMDNVNRKTTMELLIGHARNNPNRQYVFLTPQDTSILVPNEEVRIHRLADPVRGTFSQV